MKLHEKTFYELENKFKRFERTKFIPKTKSSGFYDYLRKIKDIKSVSIVALKENEISQEINIPDIEPYYLITCYTYAGDKVEVLMNDPERYYIIQQGKVAVIHFEKLSLEDKKILNQARRQFRKSLK